MIKWAFFIGLVFTAAGLPQGAYAAKRTAKPSEKIWDGQYGAGADRLVLRSFKLGSQRPEVVITYPGCFTGRVPFERCR